MGGYEIEVAGRFDGSWSRFAVALVRLSRCNNFWTVLRL